MATTGSTAELRARIAALEAHMNRLEPRSGSGTVTGAEAGAGTAEDSEAVASSEAITTSDAAAASQESDGAPAARDSASDPSGAAASPPASQPADGDGPTSPTDDPYWVLTGLQERYPDDDIVLYGGTMSAGEGSYR